MNYLFYSVKILTDDETMSAAEFSTKKLVETLERENWIDCCKHNEMIVNPDNSSMNDQHNFDFEYNQVTSEKSVKFLDIHIDQKLSFNEHFPCLCKKHFFLSCVHGRHILWNKVAYSKTTQYASEWSLNSKIW